MSAHECRWKKSISGAVPQDSLFLFLYMYVHMHASTYRSQKGVIGSCEALDVMLEAELGSNSKHA